jgi:lipoprotein-anchoring transpeptidase ErfK/SrfK
MGARTGLTASAVGVVLLSGCAAQTGSAAWNAGDAQRSSASVSATGGTSDVPTATELAVHTDGASGATVKLTDAAGKAVDGALRADGTSWVPASQLAYGTTYTATLTATGPSGQKITKTSTFTTMAKPAKAISAHTFLGDNQVVGVGAPIVLTFDHAIAKDQRAAVEKRLFVTATPAQEGSWYWFSDTEVHYRPKDHWQTGTQISVRAALGGLSVGNGYYGRSDLTLDLTVVDKDLEITVDDTTKTLTVTQDGTVVKTMPASLGKDATPSSSGHMVIMTRDTQAIFDSSTYGVPVDSPDGYRETVYFPLRLTWGGQFIHSAPWSVDAQGVDNVSHGCTNISPDNAQWLYNASHVGDPVTVEHTKRGLTWGDGWTDWDRDWASYQKGSALPAGYDESAPHA